MLCASGQAFALSRRPSPRDRRLSMRFSGVFTPFYASVSGGRGSAKGFSRRPSCRGSIALLFPLPHRLPSSMGPSLIRGGRCACRVCVPSCGGICFLFLQAYDIAFGCKSQPVFVVFFLLFGCFTFSVKTYHHACILRVLLCIIPDNGVFPGAAAASYICARPWACARPWGFCRGGFCPPVGRSCRPWACLPPVGLAPARGASACRGASARPPSGEWQAAVGYDDATITGDISSCFCYTLSR